MTVEVRLYAGLRAPSVGSSNEAALVTVAGGTTLSDLLAHLGVPADLVHLAIINGRIHHNRAVRLADGDRVALFPPIGGG